MPRRDQQDHQEINQSINSGTIQSGGGDVTISQTASQHGMTVSPTSPREFAEALHAVIAELNRGGKTTPELEDAKKELQAAATEADKPQPQGSAIRRFLFTAKGLLESIAGVAGPIATLGELIKKAPTLFGS